MTESRFFRIEEIANGVYAAIVNDGTGALGNAGFVDLGNQTLVFDTFESIDAAAHLRKVAEQVTGKQISLVVNSHWHFDHVMGNQAFQDAAIVSTSATRDIMAERLPAFLDFAKAHPEHPEMLRSKRKDPMDDALCWELERDIGDVTHVSSRINEYVTTLPTLCFEHNLTIHGTARQVQLLCYGGGHSASDTVLYLPDDRVLFAGDLVSVGYHLAMKTGDPVKWLDIIQHLHNLDFDTVATGHGPIGNRNDVSESSLYIQTAIESVGQLISNGGTQDEAAAIPVPEQWREWRGRSVWTANMRFLYDKLTAGSR